MKTIWIPISLIIGTIFLLATCEENESNPENIEGNLLRSSDCKFLKSSTITSEAPDTLSCIEYYLDESEQRLTIRHINTAFNCCPEEISCEFSIKKDTIIIEESEKVALCNCNCLFDLDMEIMGITKKTYMLKIIEPYINIQECILVKLDLDKQSQGTVCVTRKQYPWGIHSSY